jgi:hypothetical protein
MVRGQRFLGVAAVLATGAACTPLAGDLDGYSRDWVRPSEPPQAQESPLQAQPAPAATNPVGPGQDEVPIDPTLSNPDPPSDGSSAGSSEPPPGSDPEPGTPPSDPPPDPEMTPTTPDNPCPDGIAEEGSGVCYFVSSQELTWENAVITCGRWDGLLAETETPEEDFFVGSLLDQTMWLGASDTLADNVFRWTDGHPILFGNWGPAQPDAFPGADCIEKRQGVPGEPWFDVPCNIVHPFVCERPLRPAPQNPIQ